MANSSGQMLLSGLMTATTSVNAAGTYDIIGSLTLPGITKGSTANSQVVATIKQNGSTIFTGQAGAEGFMITGLTCAAGDTISVQLSSGAAVDQGLNLIKCTVAIG